MMTALTTGLALIPLAPGGDPGKEIQTPMAIVILGGLLTSTALNMIVVLRPAIPYEYRNGVNPDRVPNYLFIKSTHDLQPCQG